MVLEGVFLVMATEVLSLLLSPLILPDAKIILNNEKTRVCLTIRHMRLD